MASDPPYWQAVAQDVLYVAMEHRQLTFSDFAKLLDEHGMEIQPKTLARRLGRGAFDAGFFLLCLQVLGAQQVVLAEGAAEPVLSEKKAWLAAHGREQLDRTLGQN